MTEPRLGLSVQPPPVGGRQRLEQMLATSAAQTPRLRLQALATGAIGVLCTVWLLAIQPRSGLTATIQQLQEAIRKVDEQPHELRLQGGQAVQLTTTTPGVRLYLVAMEGRDVDLADAPSAVSRADQTPH